MDVSKDWTKEQEPDENPELCNNDDDHIFDETDMCEDDKVEHMNPTESEKEIHERVPKEPIPEVGMEFESEESALEFYKAYAKSAGFSVRLWKSHKKVQEGLTVTLDRRFCCFRQGERKSDIRDCKVKRHHAITRCKCKAEMKISCRQRTKYEVVGFVAGHNHQCVSSSQSHFFRSHRKLSASQQGEIDIARSCGLSQKQTMELMAKQAGGPEHLGFIYDDCKTYLHSKRTTKMEVSDTRGVLEYLRGKQSDDPNFVYAMQVDDDGLITNIFWADGKMRLDYYHFGDVVCFDTTYMKHQDGRPIALFVGVNNYKQTVIFGAALLYDETKPSFIWLFNTFAQTMSQKKPQTIMTDQDPAMDSALSVTWPETFHRLCVWHINQNAAKHLSAVFSDYKDFSKDFSSCMYDHDDEEDFVNAWNNMIKDYHLEDNTWLKGLFRIRKKWALVYGRETFCANMSSTQRSESMNSVIKKYISYKHDLSEFFEHFERLLEDRRYKESRADCHENQSVPSLSLPLQILKHAASIYTHKIFELFQVEVCKSHESYAELMSEMDNKTEYKVAHFLSSRSHHVTYDSGDGSVSCGCKKFEFVGILCSHALKVLNTRRIMTIPSQYIKRWWTKVAKRQDLTIEFQDKTHVDPREAKSYFYRELSQLARHLVTRAGESRKAYGIAKEGLQKLLEQVDASFEDCEVEENVNGTQSKGVIIESLVVDHSTGNTEPSYRTVRGIKSKEKITYNTSKRLKSGLEKKYQESKSSEKNVPKKEPRVCSNISNST